MTWVVAHKDLTLTDGSRRPHATGGVGVSAEEGSGVAPSLAAHTAHTFPFALAARARCWRAPPKKFEPGTPALHFGRPLWKLTRRGRIGCSGPTALRCRLPAASTRDEAKTQQSCGPETKMPPNAERNPVLHPPLHS